MSSNFKHKIVQHFEWCTELPSIDQPQESPVFLLKNNEWFFRLVYEKSGNTWFLELYLELKTKHTDIKPCHVNYQVGFKNEATLSLVNGTFEVREHREVWFISPANLQSKLPPDYIMSNCMKLIFSFDDVAVSVLNNPKKDSKCHFELSIGTRCGRSYNPSYLYFKSNGKLQPYVPITLRVAIAPDTLTSQGVTAQEDYIRSVDQVVWSYSSCDLSNSLLTFEINICIDSFKYDESTQTPSYIDKCILLDDISRDFSKLLDEDVNHDVEFTCGEQTIKAHKNVLCCRSNVFASMLQTDMVEGKTGRVNIVDMDGAIFQQLVKCLYTGILPKLTLSNALQFYNAGDKYNIGSLKQQCAEFLIDNLSPENACDILIVADRHSDEDFKKRIIEYMMEEDIPYMGEKWTDFCKENPVLANQVLNLFCRHLRQE